MRYLKAVKASEVKLEVAPTNKEQQESLGLRGQRQPIRLWEMKEPQKNGIKYIIVDGRRRIADILEMKKDIPLKKILFSALVYDYAELNDEDFHLDALTLNSGNANVMDEAYHIEYLMKELGYVKEDVAVAVNLSISTVQNRLDLIHKLLPEYQDILRKGKLSVTGAAQLVILPQKEQKKLFEAGKIRTGELKTIVGKIKREAKKAVIKEQPISEVSKQIEEVIEPKIYCNGDPVNETAKVGNDLVLSFEEVSSLIENGGGTITYEGIIYQMSMEVWHPYKHEV